MCSVVGMTPIKMHLKSLSNELKFMSERFIKNTCMSSAVSNLSTKGFSGSANNLLNLRERFLVHFRTSKAGQV
jgi:propanediol dehydratase large subunit